MTLNKTPELSSLVSAADEGGLEEVFSGSEELLLLLFTVTVLSSFLSPETSAYLIHVQCCQVELSIVKNTISVVMYSEGKVN